MPANHQGQCDVTQKLELLLHVALCCLPGTTDACGQLILPQNGVLCCPPSKILFQDMWAVHVSHQCFLVAYFANIFHNFSDILLSDVDAVEYLPTHMRKNHFRKNKSVSVSSCRPPQTGLQESDKDARSCGCLWAITFCVNCRCNFLLGKSKPPFTSSETRKDFIFPAAWPG